MPARRGSAQGVEASLRALGTDYIDLYQVHWPDPATPFEETAETLAKLIAEGKIRHVGVSNFDVEQMEAFSATLPVETLQPPYHLFRRDIEADVLPYTAAQRHRRLGLRALGPRIAGRAPRTATPSSPPGDWRAKSSDVPRRVLRPQPPSGGSTARSSPTKSWASRCRSWPWRGPWPTRRSTSPSSAPETLTTSTRPWRRRTSTSTTRSCSGSTRSWPTPPRWRGPSPEMM